MLESVPQLDQLLLVEQKYLDKLFDGKKDCYNISPISTSTRGVPRSKETIDKHRQSLRAHYETHSGPRLGVEVSCDTKKKMSLSHLGLANHKVPHSADTKRKISEAKKGQSIKRQRYDVSLLGPDGSLYEHVRDVKNFALSHGLNVDGLYGLLKAKYDSYHGWAHVTPLAGNSRTSGRHGGPRLGERQAPHQQARVRPAWS
jgi:hypothetical protein